MCFTRTEPFLCSVLAQARKRKAKIDVILLQAELHAYADGSHSKTCMTAKAMGWNMVHAPANASDPASGVGIAVCDASPRVKLLPDTAEELLECRCLKVQCRIDDSMIELVSIYLSANQNNRIEQIEALAQSGLGPTSTP